MDSMLKVVDIDPPAGQEYLYTSYPGPGLYYLARMQAYAIVINGFVSTFVATRGTLGERSGSTAQEARLDPVALLAVALHAEAAKSYIGKESE